MEVIFDTRKYVEELKQAGLDEKIARVQVTTLKDVVNNSIAAKI